MSQSKIKTKESIEYEKGLKTLHELSLKKTLSEEGIDTSKVSRKKLDDIKRIMDKQTPVHQKYQKAQQEANAITTKAQQEANAITTKVQQDLQAEIREIHKEVEEIVNSIKIEQGIIPAPEVPQTAPEAEPKKESVEEEVKEKPEAAQEDGK